ncbi:hypothetical protein DQQ10_01770 [Pseudochryseolinea flava]|uniref:Uncharacterized protein n=2 Tax=Pseudochryseolinea flava TaxID=2059302 RepID=A0A364Y725_9BACT|nr:hypothetical protein DQQ10_01770 [Pseudochryseolinea flava]
MHKSADTLYFFDAGKEQWLGKFEGNTISYTMRHDSIFRKPLAGAELYALSSTPETLPDSIKGELYLGIIQGDSVLTFEIKTAYGVNKEIFLKPSPTKRQKSFEKEIITLLTTNSLMIDAAALVGSDDSDVKTIAYPAKKNAAFEGDPFPQIDGVYKIRGIYFLFVPFRGEKLFQIIEVNQQGMLIETVCTTPRRRIQISKAPRKK